MNTQSKKRKRQERERQMEAARHLAAVQKQRELRAAGIEQNRHLRQKHSTLTDAEIPFEKSPSSGFYSTVVEFVQPKRKSKDSPAEVTDHYSSQ